MELSTRQKIMFGLFLTVLIYLVMATAYYGNIEFFVRHLYLILFLGALYLDRSFQSKHVLVLSTAVLIVNFILSLVSSPQSYLSIFGLLLVVSYVGLYFFAMTYLKNEFMQKKKIYLITGLTVPILIYYLIDSVFLLSVFQFSSIASILYLLTILARLIFPASVILYSILRHKRID